MKKRIILAIGLLVLMLFLVGCKRIDLSQLPSDQGSVDKINGVPNLLEQPKAEPVVETPESEVLEGELPPVVEEPKAVQNEFIVKKGDSFTFGKNKVTVKEIRSSTDVILDVNGETIIFYETRISDIIGDMLLIYADSNFNKGQSITLRAEDFALKENEYILKYKDKVTIHNDTVKLESIVYDNGFKSNAIWVSAISEQTSVVKILEGKEGKIGRVKVKALKIKDGQSLRQYAHVLISPA